MKRNFKAIRKSFNSKSYKKTRFFVLTFSLFFSSQTFAGVGIHQLIRVALEHLNMLGKQYSVLFDTYQSAQAQLEHLKQLKEQHTGHYGFGQLQNDLDELKSWQSPVSTWQEALENLSGGNPTRYKALMAAYEQNHPALNTSSLEKHIKPQALSRFKEDKAVNRTVQVQSAEDYNNLNRHMATIHKLSQQIEKASNTKAAIDLNSRLLSELAYIELLNVRLQSLMNQQLAQENLGELQDRAELAHFNSLEG